MNDFVTLAKLIVAAYEKHEASYVPSVYVFDKDGTRIPNGGGYYNLLIDAAVELAAEELGVDDLDVYRTPVRTMLHWPSDALTWARDVIAAASPVDVATIAHANAAVAAEAN